MVEKNTKNDLKSSAATTSGSSKLSQTSNDFRETLLKSGIDAAAFQSAEPSKIDDSEKSSIVYSVDFAEGESQIVKNETTQAMLESPGIGKKNSLKYGRWKHLTAIGGIAAIIVLQSVFQFSFIQDKNQRLAENLAENALPVEQKSEKPIINENAPAEVVKIEQKPAVEEKVTYKESETKVFIQPKKYAPKIQTEMRETTTKTALRKKEQRESTAERLRRAEKILTGI